MRDLTDVVDVFYENQRIVLHMKAGTKPDPKTVETRLAALKLGYESTSPETEVLF